MNKSHPGLSLALALLLGVCGSVASAQTIGGGDRRPIDVAPQPRPIDDGPVPIPVPIPSPIAERIAKRCVITATRRADGATESNARITRRCLDVIARLLDGGHRRRAERVARRCSNLIDRRCASASGAIARLCERCVNVLIRLGEFQLAERVKLVCSGQLDRVEKSRLESLALIRRALAAGDLEPETLR